MEVGKVKDNGFCEGETMREKERIGKILMLTALLICLTGCGRKEAAGAVETEQAEGAVSEETAEEDGLQEDIIGSEADEMPQKADSEEGNGQEGENAVKEIPIDFTFWSNSLHEEVDYFSLTLAQLKKPAGEYELRLYNQKGDILQQISCGVLTEPVEISIGDFDYYPEYPPVNDMEIFSSGASEGLYIEWDDNKLRFGETIEIPRYTEVRDGKMSVEEDNGKYLIKRICELGGREVRSFRLDKDTGELEIRDHMDGVNLFQGTAKIDGEGNLVNKDYYDMLLWKDIYLVDYPVEYDEDRWTMICGEWIDGEWTIEYESKEEMLESMGFADSEPVYQYYDWHHNLLLELYMDETMEHGCGIDYEYSYNSNMEKVADACGFVIHGLKTEKEWEDRNVYAEISSIAPDDEEGFEETIEYTPDGRPNYYLAQGMVAFNSLEGPVPTRLLELEYVYRDDGSLFYRYYWPYGASWSSQGSVYSFYDEKERVIYEYEYASCETIRYYYIYQDESDKPAYHLEVNYICDDVWLYPIK